MRSRRFNSILLRNFLLICGSMMLVVMLMLLVIYRISYQTVREEVGQAQGHSLRETASNVDQILMNFQLLMQRLCDDADVLRWSRYEAAYITTDYEEIEREKRLITRLRDACYLSDAIIDTAIYLASQDRLITANTGRNSGVRRYKEQDAPAFFDKVAGDEKVEKLLVRSREGRTVLTLWQPIPLLDTPVWGICFADFDIDQLLGRANSTMLLDGQGRIILSKDVQRIGTLLSDWGYPAPKEGAQILTLEDKTVMVSAVPSAMNTWWYYQMDELVNFDMQLSRVFQNMGSLVIWIALISIVLAAILASRLFRPIWQMVMQLEQHDTGMLSVTASPVGNELLQLSENMMNAMQHNRVLNESLAKRLQALNAVRLQMLQNQISPHFLYNMLESINWMSMEAFGEENEVSEALCSLAELLRISLRNPSVVTLEQELYSAQCYVKLQKIRFGTHVVILFDIAEETKSYNIPSMLLQPLIENAIKHGYSREIDPLRILIRTRVEQGELYLTIENNGLELSSEELARLQTELEGNAQDANIQGIGLVNVQTRLRLLFGDASGIRLVDTGGKGFQVEIVIPND